MDLTTKAKLRQKFAAQGIYLSDSQIEAKAREMGFDTSSPIKTEPKQNIYPSSNLGGDGFFDKAVDVGTKAADVGADIVGSTLWSAFDTASFGLLGAALPDVEKAVQENLMDSAAGRIAGTIGSLAGFMVPIGAVGKASSLAARTAKGIWDGGSKAIKAGKIVASPTTRQAQQMAAKKIMDATQKEAVKSGGKGLKWDEATRTAIETSDDIIGFVAKPLLGSKVLGKVFRRGPAYQMEYSLEAANNARKLMKNTMPNKIAANLAEKGIVLPRPQLLKLSDDVVETLGQKSFNSIETILAKKLSTPVRTSLLKVATSSAQELVNFGTAGVLMDYVQYKKGSIDDSTFRDQMFYHYATGAAFGPIKFIPGGVANAGAVRNFMKFSGLNTKKVNKSIKKMGLDETKAFAKVTKETDSSASLFVNNRNIGLNDLKKGRGITEAELPELKSALISHNNQLLKEFRLRYPGEAAKDFVGSLPRMIGGTLAFNAMSLKDGTFSEIGPKEGAFHWYIGAIMTKRGMPLTQGKTAKTGFGYVGERPYYYNQEMTNISNGMKQMDFTSAHIGDIVKQFDGNLYTDWVQKNPVPDVENIINVLIENDIAYDVSASGKITADNTSLVNLINSDLTDILSPIIPHMKARGIEFNPNVNKQKMKTALKNIKNLKSESLSTLDNSVLLDSKNIIKKSIIESSQAGWRDIESRLLDNFYQQIGIFTGNPDYISSDGKMNNFNYKSSLKQFENSSKYQDYRIAINKMEEILSKFQDMDIIKIADIQIGKGKGEPIKLNSEKMEQLVDLQKRFEIDLGKEFYGESFEEPIDMNDPAMWGQIRQVDHHRNVATIHDVIMERDVVNLEKADSEGIQSLLGEVLSNPENRNRDIITEFPENIKIEPPEGKFDMEEYTALVEFKNNLWSINAASGREASDVRKVTVPMEKIKQLKDELVKLGMPDPVINRLDSRMQNWVDRTINHGIERATEGLDLNPYHASAVKRLLINGVFTIKEDSKGKGVQLQTPTELTSGKILSIKPNATPEEINSYQTAYKNILKNTKNIVFQRTDFSMTMTENQLSSILTADAIFNSEKLETDIKDFYSDFDVKIIGIDEQIQVLQSELDILGDSNPTEAQQIRNAMNHQKSILNVLNKEQLSFAKSLGGSVEISRASAHLYFSKNFKNDNNKTMMDLMTDLENSPIGQFETKTQEIENLKIAIAEEVASRALKESPFSEMRQEEILKYKHEDVDGHMPADNINTTPERFLEEHKGTIEDVFNKNEPGYNLTYDSGSDLLYTLYRDKVVVGKDIDAFTDRMFKIAKTDRIEASDKVRNDITTISNLFERRFNVKRLTVNTTSGKGSFENAEISKGFLTDIYTEIFSGDQPHDMIIISSDFKENNMVKSGSSPEAKLKISTVLSGDFVATLSEGNIANLKHYKEGRASSPDGMVQYENMDIDKQLISGKHYMVGIDENINIAIPETGFNSLADSFVKWYEKNKDSNYVKKARKLKAADELFSKVLDVYYEKIINSKGEDGLYNVSKFKFGEKNDAMYMEDAMYTMFNVMYGEKIDGDWLQDAYLDSKSSRKSYKYKRLAQNQGYGRNSIKKRQMLKSAYEGTNNKYFKKIIKKYTDKDFTNTLVIDDSNNSETGESINRLITDNRSVAELNLKKQYDDGTISKSDYNNMLKTLKESNSINAESANGMTAVRREQLDYILLLNGKSELIGESSGQKPVGISSYKDGNGVIHTFYNKTHYFYDSKLDPFFKKNKDIDMVAFKSGAKKSKIIDPNVNLDNKFKPLQPTLIESGENLTTFINRISAKAGDEYVFPVKFDQTLSGTIYGAAHDAKIMKQFDNWTSKKVQADLYEYARKDVAERLAEVNINLYSPENVNLASREANSFLRSSADKTGISTEAPNASASSIWIEAGGVPFSEVSKNLYDALIKRKYIDDSGLFDGYTDAGGVPVLRANLNNDLNIPVFSDGQQKRFGEANLGASYLDRKINFLGSFGVVPVDKPGFIKKPNYRNMSTISLAYNFKNRDILIDLKNKTITDSENNKAKLSDFKDLKKSIIELEKQIKDGKIEKWRDIFNELQKDKYKDLSLAVMAMPAPRTGPHDAMVVKVKNLLPEVDGGIMELNSYDVTMRGQRDFDTDKLPFYMDIPFSAMSEAYIRSSDVLEALPTDNTTTKELDMYSNKSFKDYNQNIQEYKKARGPVIKMHRKLSYAKNVFDLINSIKLDDKAEIVFIKDNVERKAALQNLVSDSQNVLDIYDSTPNNLKSINEWTDKALFGTNGFFKLKIKDSNKQSPITEKAHKLIIEKILNDFGGLLRLEGNIYEAGEPKKARFQDMVSEYRDFQSEYSRDRINWNFYNYLSYKGYEDIANKLFFKGKTKKSDESIANIMGSISDQLATNPNPFMKSLKAAVDSDFNRARETYSPSGDYFNKGIDKLIGANRAITLEYFRANNELNELTYNKVTNPLNELWQSFYKQRTHEEMMVQANTIEEQISRSEWRLSELEKNPNIDPVAIQMQKENIQIKSGSLAYLLDKMAIDPNEYGQNIIKYKKGENKNNTINPFPNETIAIRDANNGKFKFYINDKYDLKEKEVAVKNPVELKAIVEHELLDGIAFANSTLGYYSHIQQVDLPNFRTIVRDTKTEIKASMREIMSRKGYRDWSEHQAKTQAAIEKGLGKIKTMANDSAIDDGTGINVNSKKMFFGEMPDGKESYGIDFLMSMLVPDNAGNPNQFYYSPKTGNFMHAVKAPKKSVINAVFQAMDTYQVHHNTKDFIKDFANVHRGFYDALVAGQGFNDGMRRLANTNFEGALLKSTIDKAMNNPYIPRSEFKTIAESFDITPELPSTYAELFRQIVQDGALTDPKTVFGLRKNIIESGGKEAYDAIFQMSRGQIIFDGLGSKQVGIHKGEGQLLGEVLMTRRDMLNRNLQTNKYARKGANIKDALNTVVGISNEKIEGKCD